MTLSPRVRRAALVLWNLAGSFAVLGGSLKFLGAPDDVGFYLTWFGSLPSKIDLSQIDGARLVGLAWLFLGIILLYLPLRTRLAAAYRAIKTFRPPVLVRFSTLPLGDSDSVRSEPPVESEGFIWKRGLYRDSERSDLFPHCRQHDARLLFRYDEGYSQARLPYAQYRVLELEDSQEPDDPASNVHLYCPGGNGDPGHRLEWFSESHTVGEARLIADMLRKKAIQEQQQRGK